METPLCSPSPPEDDRAAPPLPANVRWLGLTSLLNDVASESVYPLLPQLLLGMAGGNRFFLGIIEGLAETVASLLKLYAGAWSDRTGRRKTFILWGYALAAVARPITGWVGAPWQLLATRVMDRIGKGVRTAPRDALLADSTPSDSRGRAFGFHRAMDHLGAALGPLLATAFLLVWPGAVRPLFLLTIIPGIAVVVILVWGVREPSIERGEEPPAASRKSALRPAPFSADFRRLLFAIGLFTLGNSSDAFLLVRAGELGTPTWLLPLLWCLFHVVKSVGNAWAGRAVDRTGPRPLLLAGWMLYAALYLAFALATTTWQIWAIFLAYGTVYALVEPSEKKLVAELAGAERRGLAFGWFHGIVGAAAFPSSVAFGWLYEQYGATIAFGSGSLLALLAVGVLIAPRAKLPS
ncbi:MAG: MFS transporter [Pirellulales bacterium]